jgi:hypothetical protein
MDTRIWLRSLDETGKYCGTYAGKGQPLLENDSADTFIARQQLCKHANMPEQSLGYGYTRNNIGTVGSGVF